MWWKKTVAFIKKYSVALVAALTTLLTIALSLLVVSRGDGEPGLSKEELIKNQKKTVDKEIDVLEDEDSDLEKKDNIIKDKIKDINEGSKVRKEETKDDAEKIDAADGLDELLHIQDELSKRNRDR